MGEWADLIDFKPEPLQDVEFEPVKGAYVCNFDITRQKGTSLSGNEYDFYSMNLRVVETKEGNRADGRFLNRTYSMINSEFRTAEESKKRLLTDLFTAGIEYDLSSDEMFEVSLQKAKDKLINVRAFVGKNKEGEPQQRTRIVKDFKLREKKKTETVPF